MEEHLDLSQLAKSVAFDTRKNILTPIVETILHYHFKELFSRMEPDSVVEVTHGNTEFGADLVIVKRDKFGESVKAVVVKRGNVGGQTMGAVAEIVDQVKQCLVHSRGLKYYRELLHADEAYVMVVGEISGNGRVRLEAEIREAIGGRHYRIFDMAWIVDSFTKFYPQVFFEGKVVDFLREKILELEHRQLVARASEDLSKTWVEPIVASLDDPIKFDAESLTIVFEKGRMPLSKLKDLLKPPKTCIILAGDPGTGKSTALAKIALDILTEAFNSVIGSATEDTIAIPIVISAAELLGIDDCTTLLRHYVGNDEIVDRFRITTLMVDALDEARPDDRTIVLEKALAFCNELTCSLLIASRMIETIKTPMLKYHRCELLPFEFDQALKLFEKLVTDKRRLEVLKDGLSRVSRQIEMTPLSLSLLVDITESYQEIPASLTELYDRFTDIALGRFDREKGIEVLFEYEVKKRFLGHLAYEAFVNGDTLEIDLAQFELLLTDYCQRYGYSEDDLRGFIRELERSGMLSLETTVAFQHRSFLDYFAAYKIFLTHAEILDLDQLLAKLYFSDLWGDVTFFYIGQKREIKTSTIDKIFAFTGDDLSTDVQKFLVGRLLQAGWSSESKVKLDTIERMLPYAGSIRDRLLKAAEAMEANVPRIVGDALGWVICDFSLVSAFLQREERQLFEQLSSKQDIVSANMSLLLLWSLRKSLSPEEKADAINRILGSMSGIPKLDAEDQARILLALNVIEMEDKAMVRSIKRKLRRQQRKHAEIFKGLLPPSQKKSRKHKAT